MQAESNMSNFQLRIAAVDGRTGSDFSLDFDFGYLDDLFLLFLLCRFFPMMDFTQKMIIEENSFQTSLVKSQVFRIVP